MSPKQPIIDPSNANELRNYHRWWVEQEQKVRNGKGEGFTLEECGRAQDVIRITLEILNIKITGINQKENGES